MERLPNLLQIGFRRTRKEPLVTSPEKQIIQQKDNAQESATEGNDAAGKVKPRSYFEFAQKS